MFRLEPEFFIPFLVFAIPIIAIVGGITHGIVKTLGRQRLAELAARERLAAIERGIDPAKLPPPPSMEPDWAAWSGSQRDPYRRAQGLMVGGLVTLAAGIGLTVLIWTASDERNGWAVGLIPGLVGVALLLSAWIVKPRGNGAGAGPPGPAGPTS